MIIAVASDHHFAKLCEIIGQPDLIKNPKFDSDPAPFGERCGAEGHSGELLWQLHRGRGHGDDAEGIHPLRPLCTVDEACQNPSILQREMLVEIDQPGAGKLKITGNPIKLSQTPPDPCHPAPLLGQDTQGSPAGYIGFSDTQISKWKEENNV